MNFFGFTVHSGYFLLCVIIEEQPEKYDIIILKTNIDSAKFKQQISLKYYGWVWFYEKLATDIVFLTI